MKRWFSLFLIALITALSFPANAETEMNALDLTAILTGDKIFYSGSVDGETEGIFTMDLLGGNVGRIYPKSEELLAYQDGRLLIFSQDEAQGLILNEDGTIETKIDMPDKGNTAVGNGCFYVGNLEIDAATGESREMFPNDEEEAFFLITPVAVEGDFLYYLDRRKVGDNAGQDQYCASLWRVSFTDSSLDQLMDTGVKYIGMDEEYVYLERLNFWYYDDEIDEYVETSFETGLFRVSKDGSATEKLCETGSVTDDVYVSYDIIKNGVLYGFKRDYSNGYNAVQSIISISADGQAFNDVVIDEDSLRVVLDDAFVLSMYVEMEEYDRRDEIVFLSRTDGSKKVLNSEMTTVLYFSEAEPFVVSHGDAVYYLAYDIESASVALYRAAMDGSGAVKLAIGLIDPDIEEVP